MCVPNFSLSKSETRETTKMNASLNPNPHQNQQSDLSFCILWSPLPPITWILPFIGHLGIANSSGIASDFQGSYYVSDRGQNGRMAFGKATRYLKLDASQVPGGIDRWDECIQEANEVYSQRIHNICCDNCHSHVALALNKMEFSYHGIIHKWDMVKLCFLMFFQGRFVSHGAILSQFLPFTILVLIVYLTTR